MLYSRDRHNIVNKLYFSKKKYRNGRIHFFPRIYVFSFPIQSIPTLLLSSAFIPNSNLLGAEKMSLLKHKWLGSHEKKFIYLFIYLILFLNLKHYISFAKHQNESATGIHVWKKISKYFHNKRNVY